MNPETIALIQKYINSSLKTVEACVREYPMAKKYQPLMKTRGELKQILRACDEILKEKGGK